MEDTTICNSRGLRRRSGMGLEHSSPYNPIYNRAMSAVSLLDNFFILRYKIKTFVAGKKLWTVFELPES